MEYIEKTVKKNYIYQGKILNLLCDDALLPDGRPCKREIIEHSGGACVLYIKDGCVLLVKQFRYAYGECIYEIPAGKLEKGEDPALAAARELEEEAGVKAENLVRLFTLYPTPGYTNEKIYVYFAENGTQTERRLDDDEFLTAEYIPLQTVKKMLDEGEICDSKTLAALLWYFSKNPV
jgi:ADP-ribose pyrophosphatase